MNLFVIVAQPGIMLLKRHQDTLESLEWGLFRKLESGTYKVEAVFRRTITASEIIKNELLVPYVDQLRYGIRLTKGKYNTNLELSNR